ncbi:MAG: YicC/YloC family endoribonuclease [Pararhodobacter sp.]
MTGFATFGGEIMAAGGAYSAQWELRAVNGRGLDTRFRLPEGAEALETALRKHISARISRGTLNLTLRLVRRDSAGVLRLNGDALEAALDMLERAAARAQARGVALAPITAADLLAVRGVLDTAPEPLDPAPLMEALLQQAESLIEAFCQTRRAEGAALGAVLEGQIAQIEALHGLAHRAVVARRQDQADALRAALARLGEAAPQLDPGRMEQELALIAMRSDVTEELDRLLAHCAAARALLSEGGAVGRKLDFLMQEFNREANTLCSKAQNPELTRIGLDLKAVIDQMREQVQNVE